MGVVNEHARQIHTRRRPQPESSSSLKLGWMSIDHFQKAALNSPVPAFTRTATARRVYSCAGWNWTQLLMLTLAVWAALLYSGIGNAMGVLPDAAVNRIEARALTPLRQSSASHASRWAQSEPSQEVSAWAVVSGPPVLLQVLDAAVLSLSDNWFETAKPQADLPRLAGLPWQAVPRWHTPLNRAPPAQASQA